MRHSRKVLGTAVVVAISLFGVFEGARQLGIGEPDPFSSVSTAPTTDVVEGTTGSLDTLAASSSAQPKGGTTVAGALDLPPASVVEPSDVTPLLPMDPGQALDPLRARTEFSQQTATAWGASRPPTGSSGGGAGGSTMGLRLSGAIGGIGVMPGGNVSSSGSTNAQPGAAAVSKATSTAPSAPVSTDPAPSAPAPITPTPPPAAPPSSTPPSGPSASDPSSSGPSGSSPSISTPPPASAPPPAPAALGVSSAFEPPPTGGGSTAPTSSNPAGAGPAAPPDPFGAPPVTGGDAALTGDPTGSVSPTPEPGSILLIGTGLVGVLGALRKRRLL